MEIADNQHPIDLSQKCRYYDQSPSFMKSSVSSSRPLPALIPISLLHETQSTPFECFRSCKQSLLDFSFKEQSRDRKDASRFRHAPPHHPTHSSKMRKSKSETRIPPFAGGGGQSSEHHPFGRSSSSNPFNVPMHRNAAVTRSDGIRKYNAEREKNFSFDSSCFSAMKHDRRADEHEISSSVHIHSNKYVKQGTGVSLSTIQSLRKLLDKRKSMQKNT